MHSLRNRYFQHRIYYIYVNIEINSKSNQAVFHEIEELYFQDYIDIFGRKITKNQQGEFLDSGDFPPESSYIRLGSFFSQGDFLKLLVPGIHTNCELLTILHNMIFLLNKNVFRLRILSKPNQPKQFTQVYFLVQPSTTPEYSLNQEDSSSTHNKTRFNLALLHYQLHKSFIQMRTIFNSGLDSAENRFMRLILGMYCSIGNF